MGMWQNYFWNRNSNTKEINRRKKTQILSKILRVSWQEQIQKIKIFKYYTEKDKKNIWTKLSSLGQEPTFKDEFILFHAQTSAKNIGCHHHGNHFSTGD